MRKLLIILLLAVSAKASCANQTDDVSPIYSPESLPFTIRVELADFQLPSDSQNSFGLQAYAYGTYKDKWLLITGRANGLHGFVGSDDFPVSDQNTIVYVVDTKKKTVAYKSLHDSSSHLSQAQIDTLSVTSAQFTQVGNTLYIVGGYGIDTATGQFNTKSTLTAIDVPGLIKWVESSNSKVKASQYIRQTTHPLLQVTGGILSQADAHHPFLLTFGQNYYRDFSSSVNGIYTQQVRAFNIIDTGKKLSVQPVKKQPTPNTSYRRRDYNLIPIIQKTAKSLSNAYVALSGVFTESSGAWTVPVTINADGSSFMPDPLSPSTFKQGMNSYNAAHAELYSKKSNEMYILLFGGISYLSVDSIGDIVPDPQLPFINSITTVKINSNGSFEQYLMDGEFPEILSEFANPGNTLLFGAEARFIPVSNQPAFSNGVISYDNLGSSSVLLGYIVGGIQSTVPNTSTINDSSSSPYFFSVILEKR